MSGTMVIGTATGGIQDQMMFLNEDGEIYVNNDEIPSNNPAIYTRCGKWAVPMFPFLTVSGHPNTPYIYDTPASINSIVHSMIYVYNLGA